MAIAVFLVGAGAGLFLVSFILNLLDKLEPLARAGILVGPILAFIGTLFLVADLGVRTGMYRLISNLSSWMSRGTWILSVFIVFGLAYSLPAWGAFAWLPWSKATALGLGIGLVAALFSVLAIVYTGFLFGVVKRIPFWNTPILPVLFLFASLSTGIAILDLIAISLSATLEREVATALRQIGIAEIVIICLELVVLGSYLEIARHGSISAVESVRLLKTPLFIAGVVALGLVVPLCLLLFSALGSIEPMSSISVALTAVLLLAGSLLLRYLIIRAGVYLPLHSA